jgi:hypothetical protein
MLILHGDSARMREETGVADLEAIARYLPRRIGIP